MGEERKKSIYLIIKAKIKGNKTPDSAHKAMTPTEISERQIRKELHRAPDDPEEEGFVRHDEISSYSLGMSIYVLSSNAFQFIKRCGSCQALSGEGYNRTESDCPSVCA